MTEFYVPYNQIKFFTSKEKDIYRHTLAHRIYLYLCHYHHGRIHWKERKKLTQLFDTSHSTLEKAFAYLHVKGLVDIKKGGWVHATGKTNLTKKILPYVGRDFNIEFKFDFNLLFDRKKFANHLFLTIFQASAMIRGKEVKRKEVPLTNFSDCRLQGEGLDENPVSDNTVLSESGFIQLQSLTYLAKMTDRHPITIFNRNKQINAENHYLLTDNPKREKEQSFRTALTQDGFNTKEFSPIVGFRDKESADKYLSNLKSKDKSFYPCFAMEANHGGWVIAKQIPDRYTFTVSTKKSFSKYDYKFSSLQSSP